MTEKVINMLAEYTDMKKEDISRDTSLVGDMGFSSLDIVNMTVLFEDEFDIEIPDRMVSEFTTVGDVADYLSKHM